MCVWEYQRAGIDRIRKELNCRDLIMETEIERKLRTKIMLRTVYCLLVYLRLGTLDDELSMEKYYFEYVRRPRFEPPAT
jgi:hypothetical protein